MASWSSKWRFQHVIINFSLHSYKIGKDYFNFPIMHLSQIQNKQMNKTTKGKTEKIPAQFYFWSLLFILIWSHRVPFILHIRNRTCLKETTMSECLSCICSTFRHQKDISALQTSQYTQSDGALPLMNLAKINQRFK